jgi:hypothetical protein
LAGVNPYGDGTIDLCDARDVAFAMFKTGRMISWEEWSSSDSDKITQQQIDAEEAFESSI